MRFIEQKEIVARGCRFCEHRLTNKKGWVYACNKFECPYKELDGYEHFNDYLDDNGLNVDKYLVE